MDKTSKYELTNHLGNVLVVVSDRKVGVTTTGGTAFDYWKAEVLSAQDYYPFGMMMPGRSFYAEKYRFGFNGKEMDKEVRGSPGSMYDYGFRIYSPALGKFLSVDPLFKTFPWYSPYQFAGNSPILFLDLDGLEKATWYQFRFKASQNLEKKTAEQIKQKVGEGKKPKTSQEIQRGIENNIDHERLMEKTPEYSTTDTWRTSGTTGGKFESGKKLDIPGAVPPKDPLQRVEPIPDENELPIDKQKPDAMPAQISTPETDAYGNEYFRDPQGNVIPESIRHTDKKNELKPGISPSTPQEYIDKHLKKPDDQGNNKDKK